MNVFGGKVIDSFTGEYYFLSNFYHSPFEIADFVFPTVEHAYQAAKAINPVDFLKVASAPSPGGAKKLGRIITCRSDWEQQKVKVMAHCLRLKFSDPKLRQLLLDTKDATLIEGNWWGDRFWGVCKGEGQNMLGTLLMNLRWEIQNKEK